MPSDWLSFYKSQGIRPFDSTTGHPVRCNEQSKRDDLCQVAIGMADAVPSVTTLSMASHSNHTSGPSGALKGEALLALWLGLAAVAIIALIVILGYYLSKKSVEPGTRLESMELEHGGMYVFHFNNGSFYSQGTVPTERSNLSDYLQHDLEMTSQHQQMTSQQSIISHQTLNDRSCSVPQQPKTNPCLTEGLREAPANKGHLYGSQYEQCTCCSNVSIRDNLPTTAIPPLDLSRPAVKGVIPKCHKEHENFNLGLKGPLSDGEQDTFHEDTSFLDDITASEDLQSTTSNRQLLIPTYSTG